MSTDFPVSASCLASGAPSEATDVCYCAHPYGWFWKAQLSFSHKKQTRWSLVQYLSLIARKRAKTAFLSKIFSFCLGEHVWALFLLHRVHTGCQSVGSRSALCCVPGVGTDGHRRGRLAHV